MHSIFGCQEVESEHAHLVTRISALNYMGGLLLMPSRYIVSNYYFLSVCNVEIFNGSKSECSVGKCHPEHYTVGDMKITILSSGITLFHFYVYSVEDISGLKFEFRIENCTSSKYPVCLMDWIATTHHWVFAGCFLCPSPPWIAHNVDVGGVERQSETTLQRLAARARRHLPTQVACNAQ